MTTFAGEKAQRINQISQRSWRYWQVRRNRASILTRSFYIEQRLHINVR